MNAFGQVRNDAMDYHHHMNGTDEEGQHVLSCMDFGTDALVPTSVLFCQNELFCI